ncbi:MAG: MarR family transcriptional regulator, partial [Pseudomonadota bacterium]
MAQNALEAEPFREEANPEDDLKTAYLRLLTLIERLHRQLLDVIKDELERIG